MLQGPVNRDRWLRSRWEGVVSDNAFGGAFLKRASPPIFVNKTYFNAQRASNWKWCWLKPKEEMGRHQSCYFRASTAAADMSALLWCSDIRAAAAIREKFKGTDSRFFRSACRRARVKASVLCSGVNRKDFLKKQSEIMLILHQNFCSVKGGAMWLINVTILTLLYSSKQLRRVQWGGGMRDSETAWRNTKGCRLFFGNNKVIPFNLG